MSVRCTLTVRDGRDTFSVYRHDNGHPHGEDGVFASLAAMPERLRPRAEGGGFEAGDLAACIVAAWKENLGAIHLSIGRDDHGDTEYHYEVTSSGGGIYVEAFQRSWFDLGPEKWGSVAETTIRPVEQSRS